MKLGSRKKRVFRDPRNSPESFNEGTLHIVWYEGCSAKRARSLIVTHPTVQTSSVEYVSTIGQPSDLIVFLELRETDGAGFGWVQEVAELHYGEDFPDKGGGDGFEFWHSGVGFGPSNVGFEEIVEAHETEDGANEPPEEAQEGEELEEKLREEKLRVAHRETHEIRALGIVLEEKKCAREREKGMKNELGNLVESIKSKVRFLNLKKGKKPYIKMDKSASVKVEIRSRKARKLIEKTLKAADTHAR